MTIAARSAPDPAGDSRVSGRSPRALLVASAGGHLAELVLLSEVMDLPGERTWITFDTPQSRSLLSGREVHYAPFAGTRDLVGTARAALWARAFLRANHFDVAVSTGASIALAVLPLAARAGADCYYVESATRTEGPSVTARLLTPFRAINFRTQHEQWASGRWIFQPSVFDGFRAFEVPPASAPRRIVVSLGMQDFGFRRLLERLVQVVPADTDVLWQVGSTDASGLDLSFHRTLPASQLTSAMAESDVVITHAGIGSAISALNAGKRPVFVPRRKQFREHVDDHQVLIATELARRGLVFNVEAEALEWADIVRAASWRVAQDARTQGAAPKPTA
jgi:UDP-N-acetylglucosamine--N-acetylmuramyl-(pentapeptide) pyrophosphoryl-undecaprenol N-acetylglucosamine transferase